MELDLKEIVASLVRLDHVALLALMETEEPRVHQDQPVLQVLVESQEKWEFLVPLAHVVTEDRQDPQALQAQVVVPVLLEPMEILEQLGPWATEVQQAQLVLPETLALLAQLDPKDPEDLPVLEENLATGDQMVSWAHKEPQDRQVHTDAWVMSELPVYLELRDQLGLLVCLVLSVHEEMLENQVHRA